MHNVTTNPNNALPNQDVPLDPAEFLDHITRIYKTRPGVPENETLKLSQIWTRRIENADPKTMQYLGPFTSIPFSYLSLATDRAIAAGCFDVALQLLRRANWCSARAEFKKQIGKKALDLVDFTVGAARFDTAEGLLALVSVTDPDLEMLVSQKQESIVEARKAIVDQNLEPPI